MQVKRYWQVKIDGKLSIMGGNFVYGKDIAGRICRVSQIHFNSSYVIEGSVLRTSGHVIEFIRRFELYFNSNEYDPAPSEATFNHYTTEKETAQ